MTQSVVEGEQRQGDSVGELTQPFDMASAETEGVEIANPYQQSNRAYSSVPKFPNSDMTELYSDERRLSVSQARTVILSSAVGLSAIFLIVSIMGIMGVFDSPAHMNTRVETSTSSDPTKPLVTPETTTIIVSQGPPPPVTFYPEQRPEEPWQEDRRQTGTRSRPQTTTSTSGVEEPSQQPSATETEGDGEDDGSVDETSPEKDPGTETPNND